MKLVEVRKILLCGEGGVGRTTLLLRYIENRFVPDTPMTIGCNYQIKDTQIEDRAIRFLFFDFAGQQRFRFIQQSYVLGAVGAILTFDLTRPMTLENIEEWVSLIRSQNRNLPILFVGLKTDLVDDIMVDDDYALQFLEAFDFFDYIKASCKTGENVDLIFNDLGRKLLGFPRLPRTYPDPLERCRELGYLDENYRPIPRVQIPDILFKKPVITQKDIEAFINEIIDNVEEISVLASSEKGLFEEFNDRFKTTRNKFNAAIDLDISQLKSEIEQYFYLIVQKQLKSSRKILSKLKEYLYENINPCMNAYIINDYLTLKYENGKTNIYVNDVLFNHCKYLMLDIPVDKIQECNEIQSIDEAAEKLNRSLEFPSSSPYIIDPKVEFWGHCSNIQAWYENEYDTRILHRNLAFPLLKKLSDSGDTKARRVFKEEIARRFESGYPSVITYLMNEGYLSNLTAVELEVLDLDLITSNNMMFWEQLGRLFVSHKLIKKAIIAYDKVFEINPNYRMIWNDYYNREIDRTTIWLMKSQLKNLKRNTVKINGKDYKVLNDHLDLYNQEVLCITQIENLNELFELEELYLGFNLIDQINGLERLTQLKKLELTFNQIDKIENLDLLLNLKELTLDYNCIKEISGLDKVSNLETLSIKGNALREINGLTELKNLKKLVLSFNDITEIKGLHNLRNLEILDLRDNKIKEMNGLDKLPNLKELYLSGNPISNAKGIENLRKLEVLDLKMTDITDIPFNLNLLKNLKKLEISNCEVHFFPKNLKNIKVYCIQEEVPIIFSYDEIQSFEAETARHAFWNGKITQGFKKWLKSRQVLTH